VELTWVALLVEFLQQRLVEGDDAELGDGYF
jgi:hypothetical protein